MLRSLTHLPYTLLLMVVMVSSSSTGMVHTML